MTIIALAIVNSIIWTIITIRWKELRKKNISSISSLGLLCAGLPFWIITLLLVNYTHNLTYSTNYFANLIAWVVICILSNIGSIFILKHKGLSELGIYKLALSTLVAILIDVLFFNNSLNTVTLVGVILLLTSGFLLPKNNKSNEVTISTTATLSLLFALSVAVAAQYAFYKNTIMMQVDPLLNAMLAQTILFSIFLSISFKYLRNDYITNKLKIFDFTFFGILIYIFTVIEAFLFKALPITLLISLTVLNILLFQIYDLKNKELKHSWRLYFAAFLAIIAIIIIKLK